MHFIIIIIVGGLSCFFMLLMYLNTITNAITRGIPAVTVDVRSEKYDLLFWSGANTIKEFAITIDTINEAVINVISFVHVEQDF